MIDTRAGAGAMTLPLTTAMPYRVLTIKDIYGAAALSSITLTTQGADLFETGLSTMTLTDAYENITLYAGQPGYWYTIGGSKLASASIGILSTGVIQNPLQIGTLSSLNSIQFPGLQTSYFNTAIAEQTTGLGTQELLLYKASSITDQIRLQTTGNILFEAGVSGRLWPTNTQAATPTLYIQGSTSNIGIGTATPQARLDVAGTIRTQIISTLTLNVSSINATNGFVSSLTVNSLVFGNNTGYISFGDIVPTSLSTITLNSGKALISQASISSINGISLPNFLTLAGPSIVNVADI
jgi:hypothetical protein